VEKSITLLSGGQTVLFQLDQNLCNIRPDYTEAQSLSQSEIVSLGKGRHSGSKNFQQWRRRDTVMLGIAARYPTYRIWRLCNGIWIEAIFDPDPDFDFEPGTVG
jgi:hypothetical protein